MRMRHARVNRIGRDVDVITASTATDSNVTVGSLQILDCKESFGNFLCEKTLEPFTKTFFTTQ